MFYCSSTFQKICSSVGICNCNYRYLGSKGKNRKIKHVQGPFLLKTKVCAIFLRAYIQANFLVFGTAIQCPISSINNFLLDSAQCRSIISNVNFQNGVAFQKYSLDILYFKFQFSVNGDLQRILKAPRLLK